MRKTCVYLMTLISVISILVAVDYYRRPKTFRHSREFMRKYFSAPMTNGYVCAKNGWRIHPIYNEKRWHYGVDYCAPSGSGIFAIAEGQVEHFLKSKGYGKAVFVHHKSGATSVYAHVSEIKVGDGSRVKKGDLIALVGTTGIARTPHLHFEITRYWKSWLHPDDLNMFFKDVQQGNIKHRP